MTDLSHVNWRTSSRSDSGSTCVEVAQTASLTAVRDSKDPAGPALVFGRREWARFLDGAKAAEFDC